MGGKSQGGKESFRKEVNGQMLSRDPCEGRTEMCPLDLVARGLLVISSLL